MTRVVVNGNAYSDDGSTSRDMLNGGYRQWFFPFVGDTLDAIKDVVDTSSESADAAAQSALEAAESASNAKDSEDSARESAESAEEAKVYESPTPPENPSPGRQWLNTATGRKYTWYNDGNSSQWVEVETSVMVALPGSSREVLNHAILSYATLAEAEAAMATLPDGQRVEVEMDETNGGRSTLHVAQSGALVFQRFSSDFVSVKDAPFLARGDGVSDDTSAIQAALTYAASNKVRLHFPAGNYLVTATLSASLSGLGSMHLSGDGPNITKIALNTGGDGLAITLAGNWWFDGGAGNTGLSFSEMTFTTTNLNVGVGLKITGSSVSGRPGPAVHFDNVDWRGKNAFSQFWDTAVSILDMGDVWMTSPRAVIGGPGNTTSRFLHVDGTAKGNSPVSIHLTDPQIYYGGTQIDIGDYVEGVYVTQPHMVAGQIGLRWLPAAGESGLHFIGGHVSAAAKGFYLDNVFDVNVLGTLVYREGNVADWRGMHLINVGRINAGAGVLFKGLNLADGETAIYVQSSINDEKYGSLLAGCSFHSFGSRAIWLGAAANYVHVGDNQYRQCATRVLNQSTNSNVSFSPKTYVRNTAQPVTGGGATFNLDIPLPSGMFGVKPGAGFIQADSGSASAIVGYLDYANTTTTNARFVLRNPAGGNIVGSTYRFSIAVFENTSGNSF